MSRQSSSCMEREAGKMQPSSRRAALSTERQCRPLAARSIASSQRSDHSTLPLPRPLHLPPSSRLGKTWGTGRPEGSAAQNASAQKQAKAPQLLWENTSSPGDLWTQPMQGCRQDHTVQRRYHFTSLSSHSAQLPPSANINPKGN